MLVEAEEIVFGPDQDIEKFVIDHIDSAEKEIYLMVFWLTWKPIADALLRAHHRNVRLRILLVRRSFEEKLIDKHPIKEVNVPEYVVSSGLQKKCLKRYDGELLHHKIVLIDGNKILTGTCNFFNASLTRHEEHYMLLESFDLYNVFKSRFEFLWENRAADLEG